MKHLIFILFLTFLTMPVLAQNAEGEEDDAGEDNACQKQVDSLLALITPTTPDSTKKHLYYFVGVYSDNADTTIKYALKSLEYCPKDDYKYVADNYYNIGFGYFMQDKMQEALTYFFMALDGFEKINHHSKIASTYTAIGKTYQYLNVLDSSLANLDKALELFIALHDTANTTYTYLAIGNVNIDLNFHETAKEYYLKALRLDSICGNLLDMAYDYQTIGFMEKEKGNAKDAIMYLNQASNIFDTIPTNDQYYLQAKYVAYLYLADTYIDLAIKDNDTAYARRGLDNIKKIGNYFLNNSDNSNQFSMLQNYARYLSFMGKNKEALDVLTECQQYLEKDQRDITLSFYYEYLTDVYKKLGDYRNALEASEKMHTYKASAINDSTMNLVAKFEAQQAVKIHKAETAAKQRQMQIIIFSLIGGLILTTLLVIIIVKNLNIKRKANEILTLKNNLLDQQKSEIEAQRDEILNLKDEIETQKELVSEQFKKVNSVNRKLFSSINYAKRIQTAAISPQSEVDALFPENFVYYRPRDIVSGDYYHVARCGRYRVMITADCTGHGIPGGFLSMLGISALKEYCVTEDDAANPGTILDRMRTFIKATLVSSTETIDDGMDMTICSYDFDAMEMRYATANQSAILIRNGEATQLNGDRMPVGRYVAEKANFQTHILPIQKGDIIYTFSDGIQDQIGGDTTVMFGRKFLMKNLLTFLSANYTKPLATQRDLLDQTITDWRGERPQVDDMTLIGIKV